MAKAKTPPTEQTKEPAEESVAPLSRTTKLKIALVGLALLAVLIYVIIDLATDGPLTSFITSQEAIKEWANSLGVWAPLGFVLLQAAQTVVAPLPGAVTGLAGGYIFGWAGLLWTLLGSVLGSAVVFTLSKRYGRPLIERLFKPSMVKKFDFVAGKHAVKILFIIFLLPCFPDDMVCYIGGLTELPVRELVLIALIGHLPSFTITNYMGMSLGDNNFIVVFIVAVAVILVMGIVYYYRERIISLLKRGSKEEGEAKASESEIKKGTINKPKSSEADANSTKKQGNTTAKKTGSTKGVQNG